MQRWQDIIIDKIRSLPNQEADRILCGMADSTLHALAFEFGVKLPDVGGDKPVLVLAAIKGISLK